MFANTLKFVSEDLKASVLRVLNVWRERKVYSEEFVKNLEETAQLSAQKAPKAQPDSVISNEV